MPCYLFTCTKCKNNWEQNYSFSQFEKIVIPKLERCPDCGKTKKVNQVFTPPNINIGNTIGSQADKNAKSLGGKIGEEQAEKTEKINKKKGKLPWYGRLSKKKQKDILGDTNKQSQKEKIKKYIERGE